MLLLKLGDSGAQVKQLQEKLKEAKFDPGAPDGEFGAGTEAAVKAFQKSEGLVVDGIAGPRTLSKLGMIPPPVALPDITASVQIADVVKMFPGAALGNIKTHLPNVLAALSAAKLGDRVMVLTALGTIRAETAGFVPISEFISVFNTSPNGHPFDLYDNRKDLGNRGPPDGDSFKGRGFVQLTGRSNYERIGNQIGQNLVDNPNLANDSKIASTILAAFLTGVEIEIRSALVVGDFASARRAVNGGSHGLREFTQAYRTGETLIK
jgi:peptidoglycan L-alanyl-D-glutamate endopeptidase CwlK